MSLAKEVPRVMIFPLTLTCHSRCRSCAIWKLPAHQKGSAPAELIDRVLGDRLLRTSVASVNLTGGEPLTYDGITPFALGLLHRFEQLSEICLNTDGHDLDRLEAFVDAVLPGCAACGARLRVYVSLDGIDATHDHHRRHPGAFALADRALRHMAEVQRHAPDWLRVTASFTMTDANVGEVVPVFDYARELGIRVDVAPAAAPELFLSSASLKQPFQVRPERLPAVREAFAYIAKHPGVTNHTPRYYATIIETLSTGRRTRSCFFPRKGFLLMPNGDVSICGTYRDFGFGNLLEEDFDSLWAGVRRAACRASEIPGRCESCFASSYEDWDLVRGAVV
jgi:MoaA/NifB/PqqE/SkfB family radical SAM enzyme